MSITSCAWHAWPARSGSRRGAKRADNELAAAGSSLPGVSPAPRYKSRHHVVWPPADRLDADSALVHSDIASNLSAMSRIADLASDGPKLLDGLSHAHRREARIGHKPRVEVKVLAKQVFSLLPAHHPSVGAYRRPERVGSAFSDDCGRIVTTGRAGTR